MIVLYYEISCDNCGCAIGHYTFAPIRNVKEDGAIVKKGKHFCDKKCYDEYFKSDKQEQSK